MSVVAVIVGGGSGERFGRVGGKQFAPLAGQPVLAHTLAAFEACAAIDEVVVVTHPDTVPECAELVAPLLKVTAIVAGGTTRQESVASGLAAVSSDAEFVVIHDGARPLVLPETIAGVVDVLRSSSDDGVIVGHPSFDTVKRIDASHRVIATEERDVLWLVQTPQAFRTAALRAAYARAGESSDASVATDDAALIEGAGGTVRVVPGPRDNLKITVPEDLAVAEHVLLTRGRS